MKRIKMRLFLVAAVMTAGVAFAAFNWVDIATYFGGVNGAYSICFGIPASQDVTTNPLMTQWVQFRRTRAEDLSQDYTQYFRTQWTLGQTLAQGQMYCSPAEHMPRQGHFVYSVRLCPSLPPDPSMQGNCSAWTLSTDPAAAQVNGQARAWWIYGFIDPTAPANPSVTTVTP